VALSEYGHSELLKLAQQLAGVAYRWTTTFNRL
jgi:hypothetical protein